MEVRGSRTRLGGLVPNMMTWGGLRVDSVHGVHVYHRRFVCEHLP